MKKMILMVAALFSFAVASAQSDVVSTYNSGIEAMKAGEFDKAAELLEQVIIDGEMETALRFAAKRGVDVKIILPGLPDKKIAFALAKNP